MINWIAAVYIGPCRFSIHGAAPLEEEVHSFIVRVWQDSNPPQDFSQGQAAWRGSIDDVSSKKRLYFNDLDGIARFIRDQLSATPGGGGKQTSLPGNLAAWIHHEVESIRRLWISPKGPKKGSP